MITKKTVEILDAIFSDAYLIDIDFSLWDAAIRICVIADHVPSEETGWGAILLLSFRGVRKMGLSFHHHNFTPLPRDWSSEDHFQWPIYEMKIKRDAVSQLDLSSSEQFPILTIQFEDLDIDVVNGSVLKETGQIWGKLGTGFIRPGIIELYRSMSGLNQKKKNIKGRLLRPISELSDELKQKYGRGLGIKR